ECHELVLLILAEHIELLDCVQCLLFTLQPDDIGVRNHLLCKAPHRVLKGCREKEHLTLIQQHDLKLAPMDTNALVPMTLCANHHISLIQHKHCNLLGVNGLELGAPVEDCHFLTSVASNGIGQFHIWTKFPHLLNYLTDLQSEFVCGCDAQALKEPVFKW
uniref:Uncharacterized protein n=1 Tax=Monopterus albus TaxID=43700 RepID=A0A3Q3IQQ0_MONAL